MLEALREQLSQLDEERRRIHTALGLKASIYSDERVEIARHPAGGYFSPAEETRQLIERISYDPERVKWRQEWRARFERLLSKDGAQRKGGVMRRIKLTIRRQA
jgi:hypothetical protein